MNELEIKDLSFGYKTSAIRNVSFTVAKGKVTALIGASGSGKSTILKLVAGFLKPETGSITIGGERVASSHHMVPPQKRGIGLVFQNHSLLPHLTVRKNIAFGYVGVRANRDKRIKQLLRDFHIEKLAERYPHEISGGESQRVALARAMAASPNLFIMDEPFSSIDSALRRELRTECMQILRRNNTTVLLVTHEAEEAMELADHLVVIDNGEVLQTGTPREVYYHPQHPQVAELFGEINHLTDSNFINELTGVHNEDLLLRPESIELTTNCDGILGTIIFIQYRGSYDLLSVVVKGKRCLKVKAYHHRHKLGDKVHINARQKI